MSKASVSRITACTAIAAAIFAGGSSVHAASTDTWTGAVDTNWSTTTSPTNWSGGVIPATGDALVFDDSGGKVTNTDDIAGLSISGLTFNGTTNSYTLNGTTALALTGGATALVDNSTAAQTINLPLSFGASVTFTGGTAMAPLAINGAVTNTAATGSIVLTLLGNGTISDNFADSSAASLILTPNSATANWTIVDNPTSAAETLASGQINVIAGTLNYGTATSAPNFTVTAVPSDHTIGNASSPGTFNMVNGTLLLKTRLNTVNGTINLSGGNLTVWNQIQVSNGAVTNVSNFNVNGGALSIFNSTGGASGPLFVASRGTGTFTITSGSIFCSTVDVSRGAAAQSGGVASQGIVNLNGGTITTGLVSTATANTSGTGVGSTAVFNFNGGILKAKGVNATFIRDSSGSGTSVPLSVVVKSGGAIIDANSFGIGTAEVLKHDVSLGTGLDGGLTLKNSGGASAGILTLSNTETYNGSTTIQGGTLALTSSTSNNILSSSNAIIVGDTQADNAAIFDVTGSAPLAGGFILAGNQTLGGYGTVKGAVTMAANSILSPGNTIGTLTFDSSSTTSPVLTLGSGASVSDELNNSFLADDINVINAAVGDVVFNNNVINFTDLSGGSLAPGNYTLFSADAANAYAGLTVDGSGNITSGLSIGTGLSGYPGAALQESGNNIVLDLPGGGGTTTPEPASLTVIGLGVFGLIIRRKA